MYRLPPFPDILTLESIKDFLQSLKDNGFLYHIDDDPFTIWTKTNSESKRLFTNEECYALIGFWLATHSAYFTWEEIWSVYPMEDQQ